MNESSTVGVESVSAPARQRGLFLDGLCLLLLFAFARVQDAGGLADAVELTHHPDEPAQFLTGLLVYDYAREAFGANPLRFALEYYAHYPKLGLGHWPPGFHVTEAAAFVCLGPTKRAALLRQSLACASG